MSTAHEHPEWAVEVFGRSKNERARDDTCSASEGLIFHATLISADRNLFRSAFLDEIYVGAFWRKHLVMANRRAFSSHIHIVNSLDRDDHMRHAAVDEMDALVFIPNAKRDV